MSWVSAGRVYTDPQNEARALPKLHPPHSHSLGCAAAAANSLAIAFSQAAAALPLHVDSQAESPLRR
jgi:hypothetical protein